MPFEKNNKYGRGNSGAKHVKTIQWQNVGEYLSTYGSERYLEELKKAEGQEYMERFERILEYFKPKLARREQDINLKGNVKVNVNNYAQSTDIPSPPISVEDT